MAYLWRVPKEAHTLFHKRKLAYTTHTNINIHNTPCVKRTCFNSAFIGFFCQLIRAVWFCYENFKDALCTSGKETQKVNIYDINNTNAKTFTVFDPLLIKTTRLQRGNDVPQSKV